MNRCKKIAMIMLAAVPLMAAGVPCHAADAASGDAISAYSGSTDGIHDGRFRLAVAGNPSERAHYASVVGVEGAAQPAPSLIAIENGTMTIAMPAISPEFLQNGAKGISGVMVKANLISIRF